MGVKERRARQKKFLRQEILDAASELFVRDGYENVSMRRIADKIEYSPTTIYIYFKDKAELLEQVCKETFGRLVQRLSKIMEQPGDPVERLKRGLTDCIKAGKMPAMNVELASQTLWAGIHGITSLLITHYTFPWAGRDKVIHSTVDTLVAGLAG